MTNRCPLCAFLIRGNNKGQVAQGLAVGGMKQRCHAELYEQFRLNNGAMARRIVMVKFSILGKDCSRARHLFSQACQCLHCINGHFSRHELLMNNATSVKKSNQYGFDIFGRGECAIPSIVVTFSGRTGTPTFQRR